MILADFLSSITDFFDTIYLVISTFINGIVSLIKGLYGMISFVSAIGFLLPAACIAFIVLGVSARVLYMVIGR